MERYESLGLVGEGSYGTVLKCRHRDSGRLVAIKKFMDSDDDKTVKKIALREIKLLRQLRHDNLVNLLEVWKRRRRWYLVFEFVERTLLDDLEQNPNGLDLNTSRQYLYQILRAAAFCHQQHVIHRDIKPENILISQGGVVKLCDFGFARTMMAPTEGGVYTDYVATRWYRAPELLVGDTKYGRPVDVWAVGCLLIEMLTGQPLFPGDSDLDQIYHIVRCFGNLTAHHQELFYRNPVFSGVRLPECSGRVPLEQRFPKITTTALDLAQSCLQMDPERRSQCSELLEHPLFTQDSFHIRILDELNVKIQRDHRENSTLPKIGKTPRRERDEEDDKNRRGKDKKQLEDMNEKVNKEKEKKDKDGGEEKGQKTKVKQPSKPPKIIWNTSETLATKQSKTCGAKITDNPAKTTVAMKSKQGKTTGAELRKEHEISKTTKTLTSGSSEAYKTAKYLKESNKVLAKSKHGRPSSPEPQNTNTKDKNSTGLRCSSSENTVLSAIEKGVTEILRSSKSEPSQDIGKSRNNSNIKIVKLSKSSTTDHPKESPSLKASLKKDTSLTQKTGKISSTEDPEGAATLASSKLPNSGQIETSLILKPSQQSSNDHNEVAIPTIPTVAKPCKTNPTSENPTNTEKRRTSECPKALPSSPKPSKTTSTSVPKLVKNNTSLSFSHSKRLTSDSNPNHSTTALSKGALQIGSSSDTKPTNDTSVPTKPSWDLSTDANKTLQDSCNSSNKDILENCRCSKMSPVTNTDAVDMKIPNASVGDYTENPGSSEPVISHQQSTSKYTDSRTTSTPMTKEVPKTTTSVLDKENREELGLSVSVSATTKLLVNQTSKAKLGSFSNHTKSTTTLAEKTTTPTEIQRKKDNLERNNTTNTSSAADSESFASTAASDRKPSTRSSVFHNMDTTDRNNFDCSPPHSSPPPPPPPPSSTPLLLPPSSTALMPSFSVVGANSPVVSDLLNPGTGFHPGTHSVRCVEKPRHHGGIYSRLAQQSLSGHFTGSLTTQLPERSLTRERSFLSDRCYHGNSDGITVTKKKSDVHFPDLRGSALPELRGRDGKHNKGASKDQRKDKHPGPPSEPQQHGHNSPDSHSP